MRLDLKLEEIFIGNYLDLASSPIILEPDFVFTFHVEKDPPDLSKEKTSSSHAKCLNLIETYLNLLNYKHGEENFFYDLVCSIYPVDYPQKESLHYLVKISAISKEKYQNVYRRPKMGQTD